MPELKTPPASRPRPDEPLAAQTPAPPRRWRTAAAVGAVLLFLLALAAPAAYERAFQAIANGAVSLLDPVVTTVTGWFGNAALLGGVALAACLVMLLREMAVSHGFARGVLAFGLGYGGIAVFVLWLFGRQAPALTPLRLLWTGILLAAAAAVTAAAVGLARRKKDGGEKTVRPPRRRGEAAAEPGALRILTDAAAGAARQLALMLVAVIRAFWLLFFAGDLWDDPGEEPPAVPAAPAPDRASDAAEAAAPSPREEPPAEDLPETEPPAAPEKEE